MKNFLLIISLICWVFCLPIYGLDKEKLPVNEGSQQTKDIAPPLLGLLPEIWGIIFEYYNNSLVGNRGMPLCLHELNKEFYTLISNITKEITMRADKNPDEKYCPMLINNYLHVNSIKMLGGGINYYCAIDFITISHLENLRKLTINFFYFTEEHLDRLADLTKLTYLSFLDCPMCSRGREPRNFITSLTNLESLSFYGSHMPRTNDIDLFTNLQKLSTLHLSFVMEQSLRCLNNLTNIRDLSITNSWVGIGIITNLDKIENLSLQHSSINLSEINRLTNLKYLDLTDGRDIKNNHIKYLSYLTNIESIIFKRCSIDNSSLLHLTNLNNLTRLCLINCPIDSQGLLHLSKLSKLKCLELPKDK